jgi:hypothetical protein
MNSKQLLLSAFMVGSLSTTLKPADIISQEGAAMMLGTCITGFVYGYLVGSPGKSSNKVVNAGDGIALAPQTFFDVLNQLEDTSTKKPLLVGSQKLVVGSLKPKTVTNNETTTGLHCEGLGFFYKERDINFCSNYGKYQEWVDSQKQQPETQPDKEDTLE